MLHKFSAWTHLSNFDQSEHKIGRGAWSTRDYGEKSEKHLSFPPVFLNNWLNFRVWGHFEIKMLIVLGHSDINTKYFIRIFKKWACDHLKTSNLSADNFKKYSTSMGRHLSPRYGQVILVSGYPVLTAVNWSQHWCAISFLLGSQTS